MAALGFSNDAADIVTFRKAIFRMILSRAKARLTDPVDIEELDVSEAMEGISFELLSEDQRARWSRRYSRPPRASRKTSMRASPSRSLSVRA
jgi:hypothetical protein